MNPTTHVYVSLDFGSESCAVGQLLIKDRRIHFSYDDSFLQRGLELSPFMLPLQQGVYTVTDTPFEGLPGLFGDSLPDGWGRLLSDRFFASRSLSPTPLDRLTLVGNDGPGALIYAPHVQLGEVTTIPDFDVIATHTQLILQGESSEGIEELLVLNASSAGVQPKVTINLSEDRKTIVGPGEGNPWLVKFASSYDTIDCGAIEYVYSLMAQTHLFKARKGPGYFGTTRFDRKEGERLHMSSASGLLHADYRIPALDYKDLLALTLSLTTDMREVERVFRTAVFNVLSYNRDDHAKNFSFLMDSQGTWSAAPAYDLTFSHGPRGEQSTMVMGEGRNPTIEHLKNLGIVASIPLAVIKRIIEETQEALSHWRGLASTYGVTKEKIEEIAKQLEQ